MKPQRKTIVLLALPVLMAIVPFAVSQTVRTPTTGPTTMPSALIGSRQTLTEAANASAHIVVGRVEAVSEPDAASAGRQYLSEVRFVPSRSLRGGDDVPTSATALLDVFPEDRREVPPVAGQEYVMFIRDGKPPRIVKLLHADRNSIAAVEQCLADFKTSSPASRPGE
jgi:hypothetical protein